MQIIGPNGIVSVNGKVQRSIEEALNGDEIEAKLDSLKMNIDPLKGHQLYEGRYLGCWIDVQQLPEPQEELDLMLPE